MKVLKKKRKLVKILFITSNKRSHGHIFVQAHLSFFAFFFPKNAPGKTNPDLTPEVYAIASLLQSLVTNI